MIRKKNLYRKPMKPFEASRIKEENELRNKYGLKNKKEIWKTQAKVTYFRHRAKALANKPHEEQEVLFRKLRALGLKVETTADVLDLKVEDLLNRRLPTVVAQKKIANTVKQARQMVTHKRIKIDGKTVNTPSYLVLVSEENKIEAKQKAKKPKPVIEEKAQEELQENPAEASAEEPTEEAEKKEPLQDETPKEESSKEPLEESA
ncbi:MAG: 30S ribosomal protein S4 [Nanoarchaeota archaeon]|nr:30S ribosomal protein S4 [Nanoarchaeota archaeon]MBU0977948.1 30S ribosomal protein S4 [Nanoarchaeota archaeon]